MPYTDKVLACSDCGESFTFTAGEQEFHASKGFTQDPRRCPACRRLRKAQNPGQGQFEARPPRELFDAVCASCGKVAKVPFEPRGDRPVYCSECFQPQPRGLSNAAPRAGGFGGRPGGRDRGERDTFSGYSYPEIDPYDRGGRGGRSWNDRKGGGKGRRW